MPRAKWVNGNRAIQGYWTYNWSADSFYIELDSRDPITGLNRQLTVYGEKPEWGNWRLSTKREVEDE